MVVSLAIRGDRIVFGGYYEGELLLDGVHLTAANPADRNVLLGALDADGGHVWSAGFGDGASQLVEGVAIDGVGDIVVAGAFGGTMVIGADTLVAPGAAQNAFV